MESINANKNPVINNLATKNIKKSILSASIFVGLLGFSQVSIADDGIRQVDHINWDKTGSTIELTNPNTLADNEANIIFVRPLDNDGLQTSANIGIDGRFQVSLQPGQYSQIQYCAGQHNVTVAPTGIKTNDLVNAYAHVIDFAPKQNHYIYVEVDDATGMPQLSIMEESYAMTLLGNKIEQTHQISRVVADCPEVVRPEPVAKPEPTPVKIEIDKPINLRVLFEFDKAVIQPVFNDRIQAVGKYMNEHPETSTTLEGHTDSKGKDTYNMDLSQRRAEAVKQELVTKYGIAPQRINTIGFGETRPVATNATEEGRYNNRRVVATVTATK